MYLNLHYGTGHLKTQSHKNNSMTVKRGSQSNAEIGKLCKIPPQQKRKSTMYMYKFAWATLNVCMQPPVDDNKTLLTLEKIQTCHVKNDRIYICNIFLSMMKSAVKEINLTKAHYSLKLLLFSVLL